MLSEINKLLIHVSIVFKIRHRTQLCYRIRPLLIKCSSEHLHIRCFNVEIKCYLKSEIF